MSNSLLHRMQSFIDRERLFTPDDKLLLACSGGLDSTVLAHLLYAGGYDFDIAHMNFQLRGAESDGDAAFVEKLAGTLGAKFWYKAVEVKREAEPGESTQMTCRRLRHGWFTELRNHCKNYHHLVTGHHADDNLETFFINLLRGAGLSGLAGIKPRTAERKSPLLETPRVVLHEYATRNGLPWREDASNETDDYLRNRIRHHLVPLLRDKFDYAASSWNQTARNLRGDLALIGTGQLLHRDSSLGNFHFQVLDRTLFGHPNELLAYLHHQYPGFSPDQLRQIVVAEKSLQIRGNGQTAFTSGQDILFVGNHWVDLPPFGTKIITELPHKEITRVFDYSVELIPRPAALDVAGHLHLAPPTLPLHLRPRKPGDRFRPFGLKNGTKKIKDYFIDQKVPVWLRDRIYLLTDDADNILAVPGYTIDDRYRVREKDEAVLRITVK